MVKSLKKVGNSSALFLDKTVLELVGLSQGDKVNLTVHDGTIVIAPVKPGKIDPKRFEKALDDVIRRRRKVLENLAK